MQYSITISRLNPRPATLISVLAQPRVVRDALMLLFLSHLSAGLQVQESPTGGSTSALAAPSSSPEAGAHLQSGNISAAEVARRFQEFKSSPYYVAPFEDNLMAIPEAQVQFVREASQRDFELFRSIARDAVQRRGKFGSGVSLVVKYTGKLLGTFIRNRQEELRLPEFKDPKSEFFDYMADLISRGIDLSGEMKREKYYSKSRVDSEDFYQRVDALFGYLTKMLNKCPLGMYLKWADLHLFKDEPSNKRHNVSILDEGADLFAQLRGMGYESTTFVGRRIVNLLHMFARSQVPSSVDEV